MLSGLIVIGEESVENGKCLMTGLHRRAEVKGETVLQTGREVALAEEEKETARHFIFPPGG